MADEVTCPRCGHPNPLGSNFCSSCAFALGRHEDETTAVFAVGDLDVTAETELPAAEPIDGLLVVARGPNVGARIALQGQLTTLGRHPESNIFLDDITVSRRHAEITRRGGALVVRDVGSLNGTYVNRERVEEAVLKPGDELQIGKFKLVFVASQEA
jgi:hypothetical protein